MDLSYLYRLENQSKIGRGKKDEESLFLLQKENTLKYRLKEDQVREIDLRETLATSIRANNIYIKSSKLNISYGFKVTDKFYSNPMSIQFIFDQLIKNGITLRDKSKSESFINIELVANSDVLQLEVLDNGFGSQPDRSSNNLNQNYSVSVKSSIEYETGLYLISQFIKRLSGKIHFDSAIGVGTHIQIEIPNSFSF